MKSIAFPCHKNHPTNRLTLSWISQQLDSAPITALLKNSVEEYRVDADLTGHHFAFVLENEIAAHSLRRNVDKIATVLKQGYNDQLNMTLESVKVELKKV